MTNTQTEVSASTAVINEQVLASVNEVPTVEVPVAVMPVTGKPGRAKPKDAFPADVIEICKRPLPSKAIKGAPKGLSSIKTIFVTERLNQAFGEGRWHHKAEIIERNDPLAEKEPTRVVVKVTLHLLDYPWFYGESFGGNQNIDLGDSYKGAVSDALGKIVASHLAIGADVYKGEGEATSAEYEKQERAAAAAAAKATPKDQKDAKAAATAADVKTAQATVANPPDCADCLLKEPKVDAKILTWTSPTNNKVYDAADLVKQSQKKYKLDLCAACQGSRAAELKAQTSRVQ